LPKKYGLAKEASFVLETSTYTMNLKLHNITCLYLSKTYNQIVACAWLERFKHYSKKTFEICHIICELQINFSIHRQCWNYFDLVLQIYMKKRRNSWMIITGPQHGEVPPWGESKSATPSPPLLPPGGGKDHERPFAIPSFYQKCRPPKCAALGHCPPPFPLSGP